MRRQILRDDPLDLTSSEADRYSAAFAIVRRVHGNSLPLPVLRERVGVRVISVVEQLS
jgi:hypothetical protein